MSIRLLLADPHPTAIAGVRGFLDDTEIEVVAETGDCEQAAELAVSAAPDVVLLAVELSKGGGLAALTRIKQARPDLPVVMTACDRNPPDLAQAHRLGASGFLVKDFTAERLVATIRRVATGGHTWSREEGRRATGVLTSNHLPPNVSVPLTSRECEVLRHVAQGLTNTRIATELGISYETVKEHVQHVIRKVGVSDRTQAAVWAVRVGLF
jgi:DNA-binding NarL/FixJ family response regulator